MIPGKRTGLEAEKGKFPVLLPVSPIRGLARRISQVRASSDPEESALNIPISLYSPQRVDRQYTFVYYTPNVGGTITGVM
jgi:hypothetical protein